MSSTVGVMLSQGTEMTLKTLGIVFPVVGTCYSPSISAHKSGTFGESFGNCMAWVERDMSGRKWSQALRSADLLPRPSFASHQLGPLKQVTPLLRSLNEAAQELPWLVTVFLKWGHNRKHPELSPEGDNLHWPRRCTVVISSLLLEQVNTKLSRPPQEVGFPKPTSGPWWGGHRHVENLQIKLSLKIKKVWSLEGNSIRTQAELKTRWGNPSIKYLKAVWDLNWCRNSKRATYRSLQFQKYK